MSLDLALEIGCDMGYNVFPVTKGKIPLISNWNNEATTDPDVINMWWMKNPDALVAIHAKGLLVVDVDKNHVDAVDGNKWYRELDEDQMLTIGNAMQVDTPRGGHHLYFQCDNRYLTTSELYEGVDTKTVDGYIMAPGNSGYTIPSGVFLSYDELAPAPEWLTDKLDRIVDKAETSKRRNVFTTGEVIGKGCRNDAITSFAGNMRRYGATLPEIHAAISVFNDNRCDPPLTGREITNIASSIAKYEPDQTAEMLVQGVNDVDLDIAKRRRIEPVVPVELLNPGGFIGDLIDYNAECAPYPNQVIAFCGAISLLSTLLGRKVSDESDIRPNLYVLALANSGAGKDHPRKVNKMIAHKLGIDNWLAEDFASGEGVQDALLDEPVMMYQTDEIDKLLRSMNGTESSRFENIMGTFLTLFSSSNTIYTLRKLANSNKREQKGNIVEEPHVGIFGTAIPNLYYESLSTRMLTNGFFSRMLILDSGKRGDGQIPKKKKIPKRVMEAAEYLRDLSREDNETFQVVYTSDAIDVIEEFRKESERQYKKGEATANDVSCTVWSRAVEQARKLALIHAFSDDYRTETIGAESVIWATALMTAIIKRMLYMAEMYSSDSEFQKTCSRIKHILGTAKDKEMTHTELMKRSKMSKKQLDSAIETLSERHDVLIKYSGSGVSRKKSYSLI